MKSVHKLSAKRSERCRIKLHTLSRLHIILEAANKHPGEWIKRKVLIQEIDKITGKPGMLTMSSQVLAQALILGYIKRSTYDTKSHLAAYQITAYGIFTLLKMNKAQDISFLTQELQTYPTTHSDAKLQGYCAHHGYKVIEAIAYTDPQWVKHFRKYSW